MSKKPVSEFDKRVAMLSKLGVEFTKSTVWAGTPPRRPVPVKVFGGIVLGSVVSAYEWVGMMTNQGEFYLGGCCANMSHVQDMIENVFRHNGTLIDAHNICHIATALRDHGVEEPPESNLSLEKRVEKMARRFRSTVKARETGKTLLNPVITMLLLADIIDGHYAPDHLIVNSLKNTKDLKHAIAMLSLGLRSIAWHDMSNVSQLRDDVVEKQINDQREANRLLALAKVYPHFKTVESHVNQLDDVLYRGYALAKKDNPDEILANGYGFCLYQSVEEANKVLDIWRNNKKQIEEIGEKYEGGDINEFVVRHVTVSKSQGFQFKAPEGMEN
jgi:hypothetical protein